MNQNTNNSDGLTDFARNFHIMAKARDESTHTKECGKDGKAFWFLLGYNQGKIDGKKQEGDSVSHG